MLKMMLRLTPLLILKLTPNADSNKVVKLHLNVDTNANTNTAVKGSPTNIPVADPNSNGN